MKDFMGNADYIGAPEVENIGRIYDPIIDFLGPMYMLPPHCFKRDWWTSGRTDQPIIAYLDSDNQIMEDMID